MPTDIHSIESYLPSTWSLPEPQVAHWNRFLDEALHALKKTDAAQLRSWVLDSLQTTAGLTAKRAVSLWNLLRAVARGAWNEFKRMWKALWSGKITEYAKDLCKRAWEGLKDLWSWVKDQMGGAVDFAVSLKSASKQEMIEMGAAFIGAALGFVIMGGKSGGLIDSDISVLGIGHHRSIWFHSVFIGLAGEAAFLSFFKLIAVLHSNLPEGHLPVWDRMLKISGRFAQGLTMGVWVGITTHLTYDSHIDGWTPYKDLPVSLPNWGHHMIMDLNAAGAGWFSWQWADKIRRHFRKNSFTPPAMRTGIFGWGRNPLPPLEENLDVA